MNGVYTARQVASKLNVNIETIRRLLQKGKLKGFKVGRDWRIAEQDLMSYVSKQVSAGQDTLNQNNE